MPERPSPRRLYLRDIEPDWLACEAAANFLRFLRQLEHEALGTPASTPAAATDDKELLALPIGRLVRRLARFARGGTGADTDTAEDLVRRYCALLALQVRGAIPIYGASFRGSDPLLMADMRTPAHGPPPPEAFPEMAEVLLAAKARILLARDEPIALRELAALSSRPVNAVRRRVLEDYEQKDLVSWDALKELRPSENRGVRVRPAIARDFLGRQRVPGFGL